jgi:hypothetical protein
MQANHLGNVQLVYINSFLATLNARDSIKGKVDDTTFMMMSIPIRDANSSRVIADSKQEGFAIRIETSTEGTNEENSSVCPFFPIFFFFFDLMETVSNFVSSRWGVNQEKRRMARLISQVTCSLERYRFFLEILGHYFSSSNDEIIYAYHDTIKYEFIYYH